MHERKRMKSEEHVTRGQASEVAQTPLWDYCLVTEPEISEVPVFQPFPGKLHQEKIMHNERTKSEDMRPLIQLSSSGGSSRCRSTSVEVGQLIRNSEAQQEIPATLITGLSLNSSEAESDGI